MRLRTLRFLSFWLIFCGSSLCADPKEDELKQQVCSVLPAIEGWCSREKALHFIDLVLTVKPDVCVEIGVFGGSSVFPVASALKFLKHGVIIAIDPWDKIECLTSFDPVEDQEHIHWWGGINLDAIYVSYLSMLKRYKLIDYCLTLKTTSAQAIHDIETIDILYLDGSRNDAGSTQDVRLYLPKVKQGGYIWLNDALWIGKQNALDLLLESCDVITWVDGGNCILFRKR